MMSRDFDAGHTDDAFLGGRLNILQPESGYRAGIDPVLLAAATPAKSGQSVLEIGCGVGTVSLCLASRVKGLSIVGLELQKDYAELAAINASRNKHSLKVLTGDLRDNPSELRQHSFDHVIANPPYYKAQGRSEARDAGREAGRASSEPLADWIDFATRRAKPRGRLTFVQRAERLGDLLSSLDARVGDIRILPIAPREGKAATLILVHARKGAKGPLLLLNPLILHKNSNHIRDQDDYSDLATNVLRNGRALDVF